MNKPKKYIAPTLDTIKKIESTKKVSARLHLGSVRLKGFGFLKRRSPKGYLLDLKVRDPAKISIRSNTSGSLINKSLRIKIEDGYIRRERLKADKGGYSRGFEIQVFTFCSAYFRYQQEYYFRSVVPVSSGFKFDYIIQTESFKNDDFVSRGLIQIEVCGYKFELFLVDRGGQKYLITDSVSRLQAEKFTEYNWSIKVALGYMLGYLSQDNEYFFAYSQKQMRKPGGFFYKQQRDSIKTLFTPIYSNPFSIVGNSKEGKRFKDNVAEMNAMTFSKLCSIAHEIVEVKAILLLILEANAGSMLIRPAALSVALEGLATYFNRKEASRLKPIPDRKDSGEIRDELTKCLQGFESRIGTAGYAILLSKIQNINSPTNREVLKSPFSTQGIALSALDVEVLEYRNDFLHGNITLKPRTTGRTYTMDSFEVSLRLLTLLNMAILKMVGYNGFVVNHARVQGTYNGSAIKEDYFRKI